MTDSRTATKTQPYLTVEIGHVLVVVVDGRRCYRDRGFVRSLSRGGGLEEANGNQGRSMARAQNLGDARVVFVLIGATG